ncbi:translation elongation factor Ts [bacterium]|nr:translation elongation factor Ts [bacterium]|tara:strand:- start:621 stop:1061 length:441 start_codon:yes stop_codon:yes gene_type:complete
MTQDIQKLREETGAGVMDCKRALQKAKGDLKKAQEIIKEKGLAKAAKRSGRETGAGLLESYIHAERVGVLLELRCETDFVAKNKKFKELAHELAMQIAAMNPKNEKELLKQPYIKDEEETIEEIIKKTIAEIGENIEVERFTRYEI